jgi:hypothetical protein
VVAATEDALDVLGAVLARAEMGRVRASTFDTPGLKVAVVPGVAIPLTIGALRDVSFWFGGFEYDAALLEVFHLEDVFVVGSGLKINEEHGEGELGAMVSDVPYVGYVVAEQLNFGLDVVRGYRVVHILENNPERSVFLRLVGMEGSVFGG